jgi:superfamily II DNA or RNA helicase
MKYVRRDYAEECIKAILDDLKKHHSTLAVLATGTGKTWIYLQVADRWLEENPGKKVLIVAHREELISQPAKRWRAEHYEWPAIEMADQRADQCNEDDLYDSAPLNRRVVLASVQTLNSGRRCKTCTADCQKCGSVGKIITECCEEGCADCRGTGKIKVRCNECDGDGWICIEENCRDCFEHFIRRMQKFNPSDFGLIVIDEAHHSVADTYSRTLRYFHQNNPDLKWLGLTATPDRADEEAMGLIYENVSYEYNLPQPIVDGYLTPIDQQFIMVDDLNLANVRTTAGDLNTGDLENEMLAEKVLHKVTTPIVEIACGLQMGAISDLISKGKIHELPSLATKSEPTLIHAVDVAHAERMTEIINRYLPDSALCIIGTTPKNIRRDGLKRFAEGKYQFLLSCGVFLEGTDLPNVSIVGVAGTTESRSLYAQMIGRGLRPVSGLIDGIESPEERVRLIEESEKPRCLVLDFVGNCGRHKLICTADILGNELPDELVEGVIRKAEKKGQPVDVLRALMEAQERDKEERRRRQLAELKANQEKQEAAKKRAAEQRSGIAGGVSWRGSPFNPFDIMDIAPKREPAWHKGRKPSDAMKEVLSNAGVPVTDKTSWWEAHLVIEEIVSRRKKGLCTFKQAKWLEKHGYSGQTSFKECQKIINAWAANGWQRPRDM